MLPAGSSAMAAPVSVPLPPKVARNTVAPEESSFATNTSDAVVVGVRLKVRLPTAYVLPAASVSVRLTLHVVAPQGKALKSAGVAASWDARTERVQREGSLPM